MGIEPNVAAKRIALTRGIELVGETGDQTLGIPEPVGVITVMDVLEHILGGERRRISHPCCFEAP